MIWFNPYNWEDKARVILFNLFIIVSGVPLAGMFFYFLKLLFACYYG